MSSSDRQSKNEARQRKRDEAYYKIIGREIEQLTDRGCALTGEGGDYAKAYPYFEKIADLIGKEISKKNSALSSVIFKPENIKANALSNMGMCCMSLGNFEQAKEHLEQSLSLNPADPNAQLRMAKTYARLGFGKKANDLLQTLCKTPDLSVSLQRQAYSVFVQNALNHEELNIDKELLKLYYQKALQLGEHALQSIYESYLAKQNFQEQKFDETLAYFKPLLQSQNIELRTDAWYHSGLVYAKKEYKSHDLSKAAEHFKEVIQLYQNNPKDFRDALMLRKVALAAHSLAKFYDDDSETLISDAEEALKYYHLGAELNFPECLHDLGYKYEHGEDVEVNLDTAINFYERAANLNSPPSMLSLGSMLAFQIKTDKASQAGIKWLESAATHPETASPAYNNLGLFYLETFQNPDKSDRTVAETAFHYFEKAAELGNYKSMHNMASMLLYGTGIKADETLAIHWFKEAAKGNVPEAYNTLVQIYCIKLHAEKDTPRFEVYMQELATLMQASGLYPDNDLAKLHNLILEMLKFEHQAMTENFIGINDDIVATAKNNRLRNIERLKLILNKDIKDMNTINICTATHRIGALTEKSLDERDFHRENLPKILALLNEVLLRLNENRFDTHQTTNLIEGISKLQLKANLPLYAETIAKLYAFVLKNQDSFSPRHLVNIIFAASRLDPSLPFLKETLLALLKKALLHMSKFDAQSRANLVYCQAVLNPLLPEVIALTEFKLLLDSAVKTLTDNTDQLAELDEKSTSKTAATTYQQISLHQNYLAVYYFFKKYPQLVNTLKAEELQQHLASLSNLSMQPHISNLQNDVVNFLGHYVTDSDSEKDVNTLPVDACFSLSENNKFILQIDGPAHFLHGTDDSPIETQKTQFRNRFLTLSSGYPVITVPYFEWNKKSSNDEKCAYLAKRVFDATGITLETTQWKKTQAKKPRKTPRFFKSIEERYSRSADEEKYNISFNTLVTQMVVSSSSSSRSGGKFKH